MIIRLTDFMCSDQINNEMNKSPNNACISLVNYWSCTNLQKNKELLFLGAPKLLKIKFVVYFSNCQICFTNSA